jgi:hypothetical protein
MSAFNYIYLVSATRKSDTASLQPFVVILFLDNLYTVWRVESSKLA